MKIATFNINNVNKRLPNLLHWLRQSRPDIVCLQELRCEAKDFPESDLQRAGYSAVWEGQKSWNGVAILSKRSQPIVIRRCLPGDLADRQARYIEAAIDGLLIACLYLPNGNPQPGPKFDYKMKWFSRLARHAARLQKQRHPTLLVGDYNVAPTDLDIYPTKSWAKDALVQPATRKAFASLLANGWTDALRDVFGDERVYTFWTYWRDRYEKDHGLRLDHFLLSLSVTPRLVEAGVDGDVRGEDNASDHAPAWIKLESAR
jgi:exodeoxyribonuclease III